MDASNPSPAYWKQLYQLALLETDSRKIEARVDEARNAISDRLQALPSSAATEEFDALQAALRFLRILERESMERSL